MGGKEKQFFERVKKDFAKAYFFKPKSSRSVSVEIYVIGRQRGVASSDKYTHRTVCGETR
jgi:23S rRNA U2552 (ribose-2'-O)-methylase RlmE/FtsJ